MTVTVKIDKFGKIFFPKRIRNLIQGDEFEVHILDNKVELIPVMKPIELFGTLKKTNKKYLDAIHGEEHVFGS